MGKILLCLCCLALVCLSVCVTFRVLKVFCRHTKNYTFKKWGAPILSGFVGAVFCVVVIFVAVLIYSNAGFLREFIDAIGNL